MTASTPSRYWPAPIRHQRTGVWAYGPVRPEPIRPSPAEGAHMSTETPDTVVLIHGLWMTGLSWEHWVARYESRGLRALAPSWPGMDAPVAELRQDTSRFDALG